MEDNYSYEDPSFARRVIQSYLWWSEPDKMLDTVQLLIARAEQYGVELDYEEFGFIYE